MKVHMHPRRAALALMFAIASVLAACAGLGLSDVLHAPQFSVAQGYSSELRLIGPSVQSPLGGAGVRIWTRVQNPNPFGLALSALEGSLALEGTRAANVNFPWGVPLIARADTVIPLDLTIRFSDLPGLANLARTLVTQSNVNYRLDGTVTVDAGVLGQPKFGPSTLLAGNLVVRR